MTEHHDNDKTTRREMIRSAALGMGLLVYGGSRAQGQQRRMGPPLPVQPNNPSIRHLKSECRKCGRCREFCHDVTTVFAHPVPEGEDGCIHCGQCTLFCRAEALSERLHYPLVYRAVSDTKKIVVASTSPAIRVSLGEEFGLSPGTNVEGKTVGALKRLGVDHVLDTTFAADLTVMEESAELLRRLETKGEATRLPMFTSCCPAWVRFAKLFYPTLLPNLSTVKSPVMIQGALVKTYFAQKHGVDPADIYHVALTPCTAKKAELLLPGMNVAGLSLGKPAMRDVDVSLTCRELAVMLRGARISLPRMQDTAYDPLMGDGSGAGTIFGNTGGVTEAVLRTAYWKLNDKKPPDDFFELKPLRGLQGVREATVDLDRAKLKIAVVHGIGLARPLLEAVQQGRATYDLIEVMACPGGCIGGGGQPRNHDADPAQLRLARLQGLYQSDADDQLRLSYENPEIKAVYADFLGEPLGDVSTRLLHLGVELRG